MFENIFESKNMIDSMIESMIDSIIESMIKNMIESMIENMIESMIESVFKSMFESMFKNKFESINFYFIYLLSHTKLRLKQVFFLAWVWWKLIKKPQ